MSEEGFSPFDFLQVFTGYLLAGSVIGPGGLSFVSEMVQVCCLHVYNQLSLFCLPVDFLFTCLLLK